MLTNKNIWSYALVVAAVACASRQRSDAPPEGPVALPTAIPFPSPTPAQGQSVPNGNTANSVPLPELNFHKVNGELFRSGRPTEEAIAVYAKLGIKTVLSLEEYVVDVTQADREQLWVEAAGLKFVRVPMNGIMKPSIDSVSQAMNHIVASENKPVVVHCQHGSDRTGIVVASYRIKYDRWTVDAAKKELRDPVYGHSPFLYWWDDILDSIAN